MNNPSEIEIDVEEQRAWLVEHKTMNGLSWTQIQLQTGIAAGTISQFGGGKYKGRNEEIAQQIFRYRQTLAQQAQLKFEAPEIPTFFETKTSRDVMNLLAWAQRGRFAYFVGGPGIGKTETAREYAERAANVWYIKCKPSMSTVTALATAILRAMRDFTAKGSASNLSSYIIGKIRHSGGLLIFDDAQLMSIEQLEEIRALFDEAGVGVALLGNETVAARMEGGDRRAAFAQLYSRVGLKMSRPVALREDVEALADAWRIHDEQVVNKLIDLGRRPGALRICTYALELASTLARSEGGEITLKHLTAATVQLGNRPVEA